MHLLFWLFHDLINMEFDNCLARYDIPALNITIHDDQFHIKIELTLFFSDKDNIIDVEHLSCCCKHTHITL